MLTLTPRGYCDYEDVAKFLGINVGSGDTATIAEIETAIAQAEDLIDSLTGRTFIADTAYSTRIFSGTGTKIILIDDLVELEKVTVTCLDSSTEYASDQFQLYPFNRKAWHGLHCNGELYAFPDGLANVKISAKWGYSVEVPTDIALACATLAGGIYSSPQSIAKATNIVSEKIGDYSVTYSQNDYATEFTSAVNIVNRYKRVYV